MILKIKRIARIARNSEFIDKFRNQTVYVVSDKGTVEIVCKVPDFYTMLSYYKLFRTDPTRSSMSEFLTNLFEKLIADEDKFAVIRFCLEHIDNCHYGIIEGVGDKGRQCEYIYLDIYNVDIPEGEYYEE